MHESLEKQMWFGTYISFPLATPSNLPIANWNADNTFSDYFSACDNSATNNAMSPPLTSSGNTGTTAIYNSTQKYWVGTTTNTPFVGACVQRNVPNLFTDHGAMTNILVPGIPATICNQGNVGN
jgi:hypothetical protein